MSEDWQNYRCTVWHYTPTITKADDGQLLPNWPAGPNVTCAVAREVLFEMVDTQNHLRAERDALQAKVDALDAMPDDMRQDDLRYSEWDQGYEFAMETVKSVLHPEGDTPT